MKNEDKIARLFWQLIAHLVMIAQKDIPAWAERLLDAVNRPSLVLSPESRDEIRKCTRALDLKLVDLDSVAQKILDLIKVQYLGRGRVPPWPQDKKTARTVLAVSSVTLKPDGHGGKLLQIEDGPVVPIEARVSELLRYLLEADGPTEDGLIPGVPKEILLKKLGFTKDQDGALRRLKNRLCKAIEATGYSKELVVSKNGVMRFLLKRPGPSATPFTSPAPPSDFLARPPGL